jgi:cytochrome oxidase Cu insertion factor (SCO1/SenC/PrrC family)
VRAAINAILTVGLITLAGAQQTVDVTRLGPQVGQDAPGFTLTDQYGRPTTLESAMGPTGAMVVFFRSADW